MTSATGDSFSASAFLNNSPVLACTKSILIPYFSSKAGIVSSIRSSGLGEYTTKVLSESFSELVSASIDEEHPDKVRNIHPQDRKNSSFFIRILLFTNVFALQFL